VKVYAAATRDAVVAALARLLLEAFALVEVADDTP
jgi:hypothetical protein